MPIKCGLSCLAFLLVCCLTASAGSASSNEEAQAYEDIMRRLAPAVGVSPVSSSLEERITGAKSLLSGLDEGSIPLVLQSLSRAPTERKFMPLTTLGVLGVAYNAESAVPVLIQFVESYEGKAVNKNESAQLFYAQISLAQIGTLRAREFLFNRASAEYWKSHKPYRREWIDEKESPSEFHNRGIAIQALAYMGSDQADDFLHALLKTPEFRNGGPHYTGSTYDAVDLRVAVMIALENLAREKQFRKAVVDFVKEKSNPK